MSLESIFITAASGMSAQTVRLNTTASNLANANSVGRTAEETYKAKHPVFSTLMSEHSDFSGINARSKLGVRVDEIVDSKVPLQRKYQPGHPLANKDGYIYMSNVNPMEEMANMISASRDYQTNVEMMNTAKTMLLRTIRLLER